MLSAPKCGVGPDSRVLLGSGERLRVMPRLEARLRRRGVRRIEVLSVETVLGFAPRRAEDDLHLSSTVRSLARYLAGRGLLARRPAMPSERLVGAYRQHLEQVRGLAAQTCGHHGATAAALLAFVGYDHEPARLRKIDVRQMEAFVRAASARNGRESLQHEVGYRRSFLRFLAGRSEVPRGLDASIDTPRLYRVRADGAPVDDGRERR